MRIAHGLALLAGALLSACALTPTSAPTEDAKFVWGCWVSKDTPGGPPVAFLRLLPDGPNYAGSITNVRGGKWDVETHYAFSRDGSQAVLTPPGGAPTTFLRVASEMLPPPGATRITYSDGRQQLHVEGAAETLSIVRRDGLVHIWGFERDGCD